MLQVCLNGARTPAEHPALPVTPAQLAVASRDAVAAGAEDIHLHPKDSQGRDTLEPLVVDAAVAAVRAAVPGVSVGVTTGAWTSSDPGLRVLHVSRWTVLPDHASVNWHEEGTEEVARALLDRGVAVHAGLWTGTDGVRRWRDSTLGKAVTRILAEEMPGGRAADLLPRLIGSAPVLLHGQDEQAWPVLREALRLGLDVRIGLEDALNLPDGSPARDNAELVRAARRLISTMDDPHEMG
jgi:uncharacterized protein (DUF849 family)